MLYSGGNKLREVEWFFQSQLEEQAKASLSCWCCLILRDATHEPFGNSHGPHPYPRAELVQPQVFQTGWETPKVIHYVSKASWCKEQSFHSWLLWESCGEGLKPQPVGSQSVFVFSSKVIKIIYNSVPWIYAVFYLIILILGGSSLHSIEYHSVPGPIWPAGCSQRTENAK